MMPLKLFFLAFWLSIVLSGIGQFSYLPLWASSQSAQVSSKPLPEVLRISKVQPAEETVSRKYKRQAPANINIYPPFEIIPMAHGQGMLLNQQTGETYVNTYCIQDRAKTGQLLSLYESIGETNFPPSPAFLMTYLPQRCWLPMINPERQRIKFIPFPKK